MSTRENKKIIGIFGCQTEDLSVWKDLLNPIVEVNMFEQPELNKKDRVVHSENFFIHQYALSNNAKESRLEEIIRDMLAIHADMYFIAQSNSLSAEISSRLKYYGYNVVLI
mgnify:CR=1 FL=1|jgi:hypothetical protein